MDDHNINQNKYYNHINSNTTECQVHQMLESLAKKLDSSIIRVNQVSRWIARLGGLILLASVLMIFIEVVSRKLTGYSVFPATEISGYVMAIVASWSFAYALQEKAHIRIDLLYLNTGNKFRVILDVLSISTLLILSLFATHAAFEIAYDAFSTNSTSNSPLMAPLWIPQSMWLFGLVWFSISILFIFSRTIVAVLVNDQITLRTLVGSPSVNDHINETIKD